MSGVAMNIQIIVSQNPVTILHLAEQLCLLCQSKQVLPCGIVAHAYSRMIEKSDGLKPDKSLNTMCLLYMYNIPVCLFL